MEEPSHEVFLMTIQLSKALLHEGNYEVNFFRYFTIYNLRSQLTHCFMHL